MTWDKPRYRYQNHGIYRSIVQNFTNLSRPPYFFSKALEGAVCLSVSIFWWMRRYSSVATTTFCRPSSSCWTVYSIVQVGARSANLAERACMVPSRKVWRVANCLRLQALCYMFASESFAHTFLLLWWMFRYVSRTTTTFCRPSSSSWTMNSNTVIQSPGARALRQIGSARLASSGGAACAVPARKVSNARQLSLATISQQSVCFQPWGDALQSSMWIFCRPSSCCWSVI